MHTQVSQQSVRNPINIGVSVEWAIKEKQCGDWVVVRRFHNLVTNYGLTALAAAPAGAYTNPIYLVINSKYTTIPIQANPGDTSVVLVADPTLSGDTQLVLSVGTGAQEIVTFTGKSGTGPYTFTLSAALINTHPVNDPVVRQVSANDTIAAVTAEMQYDPTYNPSGRAAMTASFSPAVAQNTMQFFFSGLTATNIFFSHIGLADQQVIGALNTNLHNYAALGYNHNNTNDLEIDVTYTLQTY